MSDALREKPRFEGKVAIVTGSTRGIGRSITERLHAEGASVVINGTNEESIQQETSRYKSGAVGVKANVSEEEDVSRLISKALDAFSRVDILVNNAGITRDGLLMRMNERDWDTVLDINLKGAFLVTKAASRVMMKQRYGRIINMSSVIGIGGNAGQANYSASKAGLIGLTKSTARELASRNITVNAVAPGFIETDMTEGMTDSAKEMFLRQVTLGRYGTPDDVASAVLFLASDEAAYVTGQILAVDGGLTM